MSLIKTIRVNLKKGYDIQIGKNLNLVEYISKITNTDKIAIVSDDIVYPLYGEKLKKDLKEKGYNVYTYFFNHGEENKNLKTYEGILNFLAENEFTRTDTIIALGGGVVGDTVGFASATFLRGVKYIQIPTTLLSAVDSSVGGKTAVDLSSGKNLVGAFYQPSLVLIDAKVIEELPAEIYLDGMGEVLKYAILDQKIYQLLSKGCYDLAELIYLCVEYKRQIVEEDEFEGGKRKLLNLGHTPAHAIELLSNYQITHGKAVRMGLKIMLNHAIKTGAICKETYESLSKLIGETSCKYLPSELKEASLGDKKRVGDFINMVKIYGIGDCRIEKVNINDLEGVYS